MPELKTSQKIGNPMRLLLIPALSMCLMAGSCLTPPSPTEAIFCDVEEKRIFSQAEIDWRGVNAPWNLTRDFRTNLAWERECEEPV